MDRLRNIIVAVNPENISEDRKERRGGSMSCEVRSILSLMLPKKGGCNKMVWEVQIRKYVSLEGWLVMHLRKEI